MRLLVTGCTGFLGSNIGRLAALKGHILLGTGRLSRPGDEWPGEYIQNDLSSECPSLIENFMPDVVLHAAGPAAVGSSFSQPVEDLKAGVTTWANLLESVRRSKARSLVLFPSSAAVYGNPNSLPVREEDAIAPISPYGFHKAACELLAREYSECFNLDILTCRFFSIFGPTQRRLLIWELYQQFTGTGSTVWLDGTGTEVRDYLEIGEVTAILFRLIDRWMQSRTESQNSKRAHRIVNIASGEEIGVLDLARELSNLTCPEKTIRCRGIERRGEPQTWRADVSLLRAMMPSWRPKPFLLALSECVAAWEKERCFVS